MDKNHIYSDLISRMNELSVKDTDVSEFIVRQSILHFEKFLQMNYKEKSRGEQNE